MAQILITSAGYRGDVLRATDAIETALEGPCVG